MSLTEIEKKYIPYIYQLEKKLDADDTLDHNIKENIKEYIKYLNESNLFDTILYINKTKNKIALDMLYEKIISVIEPSEIISENEYYTEKHFINIFSNGLINQNGNESKAYTNFIKEINKIIQEYEYEYYSNENFDSTILYFRLGKIASNFKCNLSKFLLPNYINILTCICAFNKKKLIEKEFKNLMDSVVGTLYRCFGYKKAIAESVKSAVSRDEHSIEAKENKTKIAGIIILYKDMISQNICSIKEFSLIKKTTLFFDSINGKLLQNVVAPLTVTLLALTIAFTLSLASDIPVVGGITKFPLYITPILTIVGSLTGTKINNTQHIKNSLESIHNKTATKDFFRQYIQTNKIVYENTNSCKLGYKNYLNQFKHYTETTNINYDVYNFKKHIYCELYTLLCKTNIININDNEKTSEEPERNINNDEIEQIIQKFESNICSELMNEYFIYYKGLTYDEKTIFLKNMKKSTYNNIIEKNCTVNTMQPFFQYIKEQIEQETNNIKTASQLIVPEIINKGGKKTKRNKRNKHRTLKK